KNPMREEIKEADSFPYAMAAQACPILAEYFHTIVGENEIGYIVSCIALSIERKQKTTNLRNIVLICDSGAVSATLSQSRFEPAFNDYFSRVEVCDIYSLPDKALFEVDYIFRPFQFSSMYQYLSIRCNTFSTSAARGT